MSYFYLCTIPLPMRIITSTHWILALLLFFTSNFVTQAQTLDATFSSPLTNQCAGSLFTLNATTTTYQGYTWTIEGPNNFLSTSTGTTSAFYLTEPGTYNVSLTVTDGVTTETNTVNVYLNVATPATANAGVDQTICANSSVTLNVTAGGSATSMSWSGGTGTFSTNSSQVTTYTPSPSEIGIINLILTTNNPAGPCAAVSDTVMIIINQVPTVTAPTSLCVGSTAQLSPSSGGIWTSSNATISTINVTSGLATGVSPGNVTFIFTSNATSCSNSSSNVTVNSLPTVTLSANTVCVNGTVQLTPNSGGTWITNNSSVASVTYPILVTGLAQGTASFTFTNSTTGCSKTTQNLNVGVGTNPVLSVPTAFCDQTSVQLLPSTGGTWTSNIPVRAVVTNNGIATGLSAGYVTFTYVNTVTGCSATSSQVQVYGLQQVSMPNSQLCVNSTMQLSPNSGGTWVSSNPSVASITNNGLVTCLSQGTVNFTFTNTSTGCAGTSNNLTVNPLPIITLSSNTVCVNSSIQITSSNQGSSMNISNPIVASYGSNGITGNVEGTFFITIVSPIGCTNTSEQITVTANATVNPIPDQIVCAGESTSPITFSGSSQQYNWTNDNTSIGLATSGTGNISGFSTTNPTSINQIATITVTPISGSCNSTPTTFTITVIPLPTVNPVADQIVCHNQATQTIVFSGNNPNTTYEWVHSNQAIGFISFAGVGSIPSFQAQNTSSSPLISTFTVTPSLNGCLGTAINFTITVNSSATVNPIPDQIVCAGDSTTPITFSGSAQQYNWTSNSVSIGLEPSGTGNIAGFITTNYALINQIATITVTPISGSCNSTPTTFTITVKPMPTVDTPQNQTRCHNDSTFAISFSGAIMGTDYHWTNSNSSIGYVNSGTGNLPSFQVQNTTFGSQIANFVVTPSLNGCLGSSINFDITVLPLPIVNAGNDTTLCFGESFTPIVTGNASTFIWDNGLVYNTPFTPTFTNTYTVIGSNNTCYNSDSITVTVNSVPQLTISTFDGEDSLACDGTLSVLVTDGTAPYSYTWTNGASNYTTPAIQDLCSGTYSLAVVDANGCSAINSATINDTLLENVLGDTLIFTDNIYQDSTIIGADTSAWIENCTFDYSLVTGATIDSYIDSGDSTIVTWIVALSTGSSVSVDATYYISPGTTGVYDLILQLYCSAKSDPKFIIASSRLYYEASTIGIQSLSLNNVFLYPNPTFDKIYLQTSNNLTRQDYVITDFLGRIVQSGKISSEKQEISLVTLSSGVYYISIQNSVNKLKINKL